MPVTVFMQAAWACSLAGDASAEVSCAAEHALLSAGVTCNMMQSLLDDACLLCMIVCLHHNTLPIRQSLPLCLEMLTSSNK